VKLPGVKETCEGCSAYLHCCLNCRFYDPTKNNQCSSPTADWVPDKENCNFCDDFQFADRKPGDSDDTPLKRTRSALDNLFGDEETPSDQQKLDKFKDLFQD